MEQGIVTNTSNEAVELMWNGQYHYFGPGQGRVYSIDLARAIAGENEALQLGEDETMVEGAEVVAPTAVVAEDDEMEALRAEAESLGINPGKRGKGLLMAAIAKAKKAA